MTVTPEAPATTSLWQLAIDTQEIDGELAVALDLLSGDEDEQARANDLITSLLERAADKAALLKQKANAICHVREALLGKAAFLRKSAEERIARAEAEERTAERLLKYLITVLSRLHPGQKKFDLPEYTLASRTTKAIEIVDEALIPKDARRTELKLKLPAGSSDLADKLITLLHEAMGEAAGGGIENAADLTISWSPDKKALKALIESGQGAPGARQVANTSWSVK